MSKDVSLIEAIQKLTAAVEANTAAVLGDKAIPPRRPIEHVMPEAAVKAEPTEIDYATDVKPVLLKLISKDRDKAAKVLAEFGAEKGYQVAKDDLPTFLANVLNALADG